MKTALRNSFYIYFIVCGFVLILGWVQQNDFKIFILFCFLHEIHLIPCGLSVVCVCLLFVRAVCILVREK